ncbi:TIGR03083 family protein [Nocardioides sp. YR527]|uniref:maleylpyruvate isomerase family mycothiol-dependent enzyme n=1 Tax=Nocardioides sp. YR527 TaxID=1881028 RepID=UPI00087EEFA8|nr:maleylpyruvate isomerase family mycothiol-dependent enzyme [Nocardioides sp. YR527]SDK02319.1 TIGR03083 family protein [Nocardioides sp. YR527]
MTSAEQLKTYVDSWWSSVQDLLTLLEDLSEPDWDRPTDLPGWDVRAIASHVAHLEGLTAGAPREDATVPESAHIKSPMGQFTEIGVLTRREASPASIIDEIRRYSAVRHDELLASPPEDPAVPASGIFGALGWTTGKLLRNRPLDVWLHEQDIRRATGRPGHLDSPGALHTADYLLEGVGFVLAKKAGGAPGATVVVEVEGHAPYAFTVTKEGKGVPVADPTAPTVTLRTDRETYVLLAGGRASGDPSKVEITGDTVLGTKIVENLNITP